MAIRTTSPATMTRSRRFMRDGDGATGGRNPADGGDLDGSDRGRREDERRQREDDEQDEEDDRELPEPALDAAAAAVDRGIAAERAGQAGPPGLEQDRGDQRDADDDLADGQERVHVRIALRWERLRMISALVRRYQQRCAGHAR